MYEATIYGSLDYIGLDAHGNIHFFIEKESSLSISKVLRELKEFQGKEVLIIVKPLRR